MFENLQQLGFKPSGHNSQPSKTEADTIEAKLNNSLPKPFDKTNQNMSKQNKTYCKPIAKLIWTVPQQNTLKLTRKQNQHSLQSLQTRPSAPTRISGF